MPTLWQMLMNCVYGDPKPKPQIFNPLNLSIGNQILIDTVELSIGYIKNIREIKTGEVNKFVDYEIELGENLKILRVSKNDNENHFILLNKLDSFPYNKEYHEGLKFENNNGEAMEGDAKYWRINDCQSEWIALKTDIHQENQEELTYWDFHRQTKNEVGTEYIEYYFVEMDQYGMFTILLGSEIDKSRITILGVK